MSTNEPLSLRERRRIETETAIHNAALRLFAEHGSQATTTDQIAELAGISTRTFFRYFETKESAALPSLGALESLFERLSGKIRTIEDVGPVLDVIFHSVIEELNEEEASATRLFFSLLENDAAIRDAASARDAHIEELLTRKLSARLPEVDTLELRLIVATFVAQSRTVWAYWYELDQDPERPSVGISELLSRAQKILSSHFH
ncbi:TetR family transcriptional regulator [Corynebacterium sp. A21]|uniref:TetR family transcriptional regulator n=1 Tax=Corynebacterium sp. A21 TaxID=3457318 RepID=UPI003FD5E5EE